MKASELIQKGKSLSEVVEEIEALKKDTRILVSVKNLKYMVRSGRLNKTAGLAGSIVNLKPVVSLDEEGKGSIAAKAFSIRSNMDKIIQLMDEDHKNKKITRFAILHANDEKRALEMKERAKALLGYEPEYIMNISTIVGMRAGVGTVAVSYMSEDENS